MKGVSGFVYVEDGIGLDVRSLLDSSASISNGLATLEVVVGVTGVRRADEVDFEVGVVGFLLNGTPVPAEEQKVGKVQTEAGLRGLVSPQGIVLTKL